MRPGEVVLMRGMDLTMQGEVWQYRPGSDRGPHGAHKTAWRGHERIIAVGPQAQEVLKPFFKIDLTAYLFSPAEAMEEFIASRRKPRVNDLGASSLRVARQARKSGPWRDHYSVGSYRRAVVKGCEKADRAAHEADPTLPQSQVIVPAWHPHQLRHTRATEIHRVAGIDAARAVLGHRSAAITATYIEMDTTKAAELMKKLG